MSSQEIVNLQRTVVDLQAGLNAARDTTHAMIHLLAHLYTARCLSAPDPLAAYKQTALILLDSLGAVGPGELPTYDCALRDDVATGLRQHVGQFLLLLQTHVEANLRSRPTPSSF